MSITKKDKALKLALEALEYIDRQDNDRDFLSPEECCNLDDAITAIREALAEQPALEHEPENEPWCSMHSKPATPEMNVAVDAALGIVREQPAQRQNSIEPIEFLSGFLTERLAIERGIEWTPAIHDLCNRAIEEEKLAEQPAQQQEPVAEVARYDRIHWYDACTHTPVGTKLYTSPPASKPLVGLTPREIELIDGMIEVQMRHAEQCDRIANRAMAEKQKGWDMERVALLQKLREKNQ